MDELYERILVLSTGHMTKLDAEMLTDLSNTNYGPPLPRIFSHQLGWILCIPMELENYTKCLKALKAYGFNEAFIRAVALAARLGCSFLNFDQDGLQVDELPLHEW